MFLMIIKPNKAWVNTEISPIKKFSESAIINESIALIKNKPRFTRPGNGIPKVIFKIMTDIIISGINIKMVEDRKTPKLDARRRYR